MCVHCTVHNVAHNIAQNRPDNFSPRPNNHHCSDVVYLREGDGPKASRVTWEVQIPYGKGQFCCVLPYLNTVAKVSVLYLV